jgi:hypothetical protein
LTADEGFFAAFQCWQELNRDEEAPQCSQKPHTDWMVLPATKLQKYKSTTASKGHDGPGGSRRNPQVAVQLGLITTLQEWGRPTRAVSRVQSVSTPESIGIDYP